MNRSLGNSTRRAILRNGLASIAAASLLPLGPWLAAHHASAAEPAQVLPPPVLDAPAAGRGADLQVTVLAGGCFWGVQGVYQHVKGVRKAVSGYAGGDQRTANYNAVTTGATGHAEAVEVTFDPSEISYGRILQIFFSVVHDPTQLNRQGPDIGPHYRSAIFPRSAEQAHMARAYVAQLNQARVFRSAIVTRLESGREFYAAEDYHQDFMYKNPMHPYVLMHDAPKIEDLKRLFPEFYRNDPVLVAATGAAN